jgi:predicted enzyme related to lactoylglutathione lyase
LQRLRKIDCVMHYVRDPEASAQFYELVLGLQRAWADAARGMVGMRFAESDAEIVLHTDATLPSPDICYLVDDVAQFCEGYRQAGHRILAEPFAVRSGLYAVLADPDGNAIGIIDLTAFGGQPRYDEA